jgi:hypothetical protein
MTINKTTNSQIQDSINRKSRRNRLSLKIREAQNKRNQLCMKALKKSSSQKTKRPNPKNKNLRKSQSQKTANHATSVSRKPTKRRFQWPPPMRLSRLNRTKNPLTNLKQNQKYSQTNRNKV